ncbi:hypothetical protein GGD50_004208 [Rhizobium paranaense]|uniref:Uncharacterized protein n=1 Tax=Rhizobium paranaense TaxID=1650438 RepID=A0A7W8XU03_9HYPH|nr:hypothetical protein [Rhizobium paranaense]
MVSSASISQSGTARLIAIAISRVVFVSNWFPGFRTVRSDFDILSQAKSQWNHIGYSLCYRYGGGGDGRRLSNYPHHQFDAAPENSVNITYRLARPSMHRDICVAD